MNAPPPSCLKATGPGPPNAAPASRPRIRRRLAELSARPGEAPWLDGAFRAGGLKMLAGLGQLKRSGIVTDCAKTSPPGVARALARPACKRAFGARLGGVHWQGRGRGTACGFGERRGRRGPRPLRVRTRSGLRPPCLHCGAAMTVTVWTRVRSAHIGLSPSSSQARARVSGISCASRAL